MSNELFDYQYEDICAFQAMPGDVMRYNGTQFVEIVGTHGVPSRRFVYLTLANGARFSVRALAEIEIQKRIAS